MDKNTPPPDRVALLAIKLFFSLMRWALGAALGAPVWTLKAFYSGVTRRAVDRGWDDDLVANEGPRDLADDVRDRVTNKDYEAFATAVANDEGDWDVIASGRVGCCTYRMLRGVSAEDKRMMKKGLAKFRTEVLAAGVPAEILFHAQTDLLGRQAWDSTTLHPTCVEREDAENKEKEFTAQDVVYWRLKYPRLMAPRDYLVSRRMWYDKKNEMATCICRDALEEQASTDDGSARGGRQIHVQRHHGGKERRSQRQSVRIHLLRRSRRATETRSHGCGKRTRRIHGDVQ
jgi:hypothetical protein